MKNFTKYILPRYTWFLIWYKQWFRNADGIKGYAHQAMNGLMQSTMSLAEKLKNENKSLSEAVKTQKVALEKWYAHPTVDADEYDEIRSTVVNLSYWITGGIIAEAAFNFFGISAVILQQGLGWMLLKVIFGIVFTGIGIYIFKRWFATILNKPMYKQTEIKTRNWKDLAMLTLLCFTYEYTIYYLCRIRGIALEGASGDGIFINFVLLAGIIIPLIAGYLAYDRSLFLSAFRNTLRIDNIEKSIAAKESKIATNMQKMEDHFKHQVQDSWAVLQEFKIYKENYNTTHDIKEENIVGHYCETHDTYENEASRRYTKEVLHIETYQPTLLITREQLNGHSKQLAETINN